VGSPRRQAVLAAAGAVELSNNLGKSLLLSLRC
jgi:hypothetical protein